MGYLPGETGTSLWATAATFMQAGIETYDLRPRLRSLTVPFLVLVGEHDPLLMGAAVDQAVAPMPQAAVRRVPGLAHTLDRPEVIAAEVVAFVRERAGVDRSG